VTTPWRREVCLRPAYARLYPDVPAGRWLPATDVAELLVRRGQEARRARVYRRTLDPTHFQFRGGLSPDRPADAHPRATDENPDRERDGAEQPDPTS
jgi:hypothetical protein